MTSERFDDGQWPTLMSEIRRLSGNAIEALEYGLEHPNDDPGLREAALKASGYLADIRELVGPMDG